MKKILIFILSYLGCITEIYAANIGQANNVNSWGQAAYWKMCKGHNIGSDNPCIGVSRGKCVAKSWPSPRDNWRERGISMMVAVESTSGGAKFCPTSIVARNTSKGNAWTEYYSAGSNCVWLCRKGFTGENCMVAVENASTCDKTQLLQSNYDTIKATDSATTANIEDKVAMWGANYYEGCGLNKGQEHDLIMAISNWLPSGHGAWVKPYMIRAEREGWSPMNSWIDVYDASSIQFDDNSSTHAMLGCKDGYKPNDNGNDCIEIKSGLCRLDYCSGWKEALYKANIDAYNEVTIYPDKCYQYRCKATGEGFKSDSDRTCTSCGTTIMDGVNPKTGVCVHCPVGKIFDGSAPGNCADTASVDKNRLLYGSGKQSDNIDAQCWTMLDVDKYKACVLKGLVKYKY